MSKPLKLVYVEWLDAARAPSGWEVLDNVSAAPSVCKSAGWLIYRDKHCLRIAPHLVEESEHSARQSCGDMTIPVRAVVKIKTLRV